MGKLIGTPDGLAHQNHRQTVPLLLMPEEAALLLERGWAECQTTLTRPDELQLQKRHERLEAERNGALVEYQDAYCAHAADKLRENVQQLMQTVRKKRQLPPDDQLDGEQVVQERLQCIGKPTLNEMPFRILRAAQETQNVVDLSDLKLFSCERERFCYEVYKKLYDLNFYLTSGLKFGCDFLAYKHDPLLFHSSFLVVCESNVDRLHEKQMFSFNRLASQVKKSVVLAIGRCDQFPSQIDLMTIEWKSGRVKVD
jgi:tRNA-splicing endonuclease subunit Sen34